MKFKILVVLYNKDFSDAESICSLINSQDSISRDSTLIIWDNSLVSQPPNNVLALQTKFLNIEVKYISKNVNVPLSKIYNQVISYVLNDEFLVILDHDSVFDSSYFESLKFNIQCYPNINLFLPLIKSNNRIVSPAFLYYFYGRVWKQEKTGLIKSRNITAINSGMVISGNYLASKFVGYDESLDFYETDNDFMYKYSLTNEMICVFKVNFVHKLDYFDNDNVLDKLRRFRMVRKGCLIHMKNRNFMIYILALLYFYLLSIKLSFIYKNNLFVKNYEN